MKKNIPIALSFALAAGAIVPSAFAETSDVPAAGEVVTDEEAEQVQEKFIKLTGTFQSFEERTNGSLYALIEKGEEIFAVVVDENTVVVDNAGNPIELEKGMEFTAFVDADKPMLMIYPPQYSPELIVVQTEEQGFVEVDEFDKEFTGKKLKLNISDETVIENLSGTKLEASDVAEANAAVFYTASTRSIPAQTTPSKVIVLKHDEKTVDKEAVQELIDKDFYEVDGVKMIPLRLVAEQLGWKVESTGKGAVVSKEDTVFTITRETKTYDHNGEESQFKAAPSLLEPTKTYVPVDFVDYLLK
jgi:hypothetical protein